MAQQVINIGTVPDDNTGDLVRDAFSKANDNYNELYAALNPTTGLYKWGLGDYWAGTGVSPLTNIDSDNDWDMVALGDIHGLSIKAGKLYSWGLNLSGRTGQNTTSGNTPIPTQVESETDWWKISAGSDFSLGIRKTWNTDHYDYTLWSWGEGGQYATGLGAITDKTTPNQVGIATDWEWISAGMLWSCGVAGGKLYTWGANTSYKTGQNTSTGSTTTPTSYDDSTGWTKCYAGYNFGIGIKSGQLWSWGESGLYATGQGDTTDLLVPTQVGAAINWASGNAGYGHAGAINTSGELYMWGAGGYGRLGTGSSSNVTSPTQIGADTDWENINCNGNSATTGTYEFTFAIKGGKLYATGIDTYGQCGQGVIGTSYTTFQQIGTGTNYINVGAGGGFGMAIRQTPTTTTTTTTV